MADYKWAMDLAKSLINQNGENASKFVLYEPTTPDPDKPWQTGDPVESTQDTDAVWLQPNQQDFVMGYTPPEETHTEYWKVLVPALGLAKPPQLQGFIKRESGDTFKINKIRILSPSGQPIMFTLFVYK